MAHAFNHLGTPARPSAAHPTPSSDRALHSGLPKIPRPPVQNPFDKFSQNDFDAWIGRLTGDLERALGYEELAQSRVLSSSLPHAAKQADQGDDYLEADSCIEDSFAEVKARRMLDKGKARDPREGPGLGPKYGDKDQPIEILSVDEDEDEEKEEILRFEESDEGDEEYEEEDYEEEKEEQDVRRAEPSTVREDWRRRRQKVESGIIDEDRLQPVDEELDEDEDGVGSEAEEYDEDEEGEAEAFDRQSSEEVIELLSDEEAGPSIAKQQREEEEEFLSDEEAPEAQSSPVPSDEDGGDEPKAQEDEEIQASDQDTSFPPHSTNQLVDIRDPWAQVSKYAEDYYAGGEVVPDVKGRLSAHHLGVNDDGSGFLTPDVINPESEGEEEGEEEKEEEEESEDIEDEAKEVESEDLDENDHLFNRLRSYTQHRSFVYSDLRHKDRGQQDFIVRTGPGSNEEPIMIDSDDEAEMPASIHRKPEEEVAREGKDDRTAEEQPEEVSALGVNTEGREVEDEATTKSQDEISGETRDAPIIPTTGTRDQEQEQFQSIDQRAHEEIQLLTQSTEIVEQTPSGIPFLEGPPTEPSKSSEVRGTLGAGEETNTIQASSAPVNNLVDWNLDFPSAFPNVHDLVGVPRISLSHLDVPSAIPGLQHGLDIMATNVGAEVLGFEQMVTQSGFGDHPTVHTQVEVHTSKGCAVTEEVVDEEVDELDELDEPGVLPLMTSDLEYPIESEGQEKVPVNETSREGSPKPFGPLAAEGKVLPSEAFEVERENISIFVEEPEDYYPGTPPEQITINIEAATPLPISQSNSPVVAPEREFDNLPASPKQACMPGIRDAGGFEPVSVSAASPIPQHSTFGKGKNSAEPTRIVEEERDEAPTQEPVETTSVNELVTIGEVTQDAEAEAIDITITVEQEPIALEEEQLLYIIEEPITDSEYHGSEGPDRGTSIGIVSVQSDEVMSPTVETGDVEEIVSDVELQDIDSHAEAKATVENQISKEADVRDAQSLNQVSDEVKEAELDKFTGSPTPTRAHTAPNIPPEVINDDYFTQPGSPAMAPQNPDALGHNNFPATLTPNGSLPSIIQLPGTPQRVLSPVSTPAPGPTPVSIAVEPVVLKALKENPGLFSGIVFPPVTPPSQRSLQSTAVEIAPAAAASSDAETITTPPTDISPPPQPSFLGSDGRPTPNVVPTSIPVTTTTSRKPTLYEDPYPYSLSTPGPPHEENEEEGSEEDTEDHSPISSLGEKEPEAVFNNVADLELRYPTAEPLQPMTLTTDIEIEPVMENVLDTEKGLVDIEAEADALIDQFLVDEPESDTDADGEADPEFVGLESSVSARASEEIVVEEPGELASHTDIATNENEVPMTTKAVLNEIEDVSVKGPEVEDVDEAPLEKSKVVPKETAPELDEQDPFKLMGNESLVAPGEALGGTPKDEEEKSESEVGVVESVDLQLAPSNETLVEVPAAPTAPVQVVPLSPPQVPSPGHTSSLLGPGYRADTPGRASPFDQAVAFLDSPQQKEHKQAASSLAPGHVQVVVQVPPLGVTSPGIKQSETYLPVSQPGAEGSSRKIHISVEDPYNADNDTDREHGTKASRTRKRKRSVSEISNGELSPITPKSASAIRGKSKALRLTAKGSRSRKEGNRKTNLFSSNVTSRSPSVASTAISDSSSFAQLSPSYPSLPSSDPRPFIHAHSRRKRGNAPTTVQEQLHKQLHKSTLGSRSQSGILRAEDVLTKAPSNTSASTSSPMTRSHCRYHKISIPKTENGPRINFLVPGCSLNDEKLIEEEEIEDHGEAIIKGDTRIADYIETLNFEPYLLWAMRQLVGTELLRENEVFYLPEPGETIVRNPQEPEKKKGTRPSKKRSKLTDENAVYSSQISGTRPSPSRASSAGSSASVLQQTIAGSDIEDLSTVTETEGEKPSPTKSQKKGDEEDTNVFNISPAKGEVSAFSRKRGRRLGQDAAAYHPSSDDGNSTDFSDHNTSRKPTRSRGLKRSRTSEANAAEGAGAGTDGRRVKKSKTRLSLSQSQPQVDASQPLTTQGQPQIQTHPVPQAEAQNAYIGGNNQSCPVTATNLSSSSLESR